MDLQGEACDPELAMLREARADGLRWCAEQFRRMAGEPEADARKKLDDARSTARSALPGLNSIIARLRANPVMGLMACQEIGREFELCAEAFREIAGAT
jgi:hypothetical protein